MTRLPDLLHRVARRVADVADDLHRRADPLLPPAHLRRTYYRDRRPETFARACDVAARELLDHGLRPHDRLLEIGCGVGNLPLGLRGHLTEPGGYDGLDVHAAAVRWCRSAITPRLPHFRFHHADVINEPYNPRGRTPDAAYRFPFDDTVFDAVFLGSVFTHMLPAGVAKYLAEIARVLKPGGLLVASYFLLNDVSRPGVAAGTSFLPFPFCHESGHCLLHDAAIPGAAVALDEDFVLGHHARLGLRPRGPIRRGGWWRGTAHDQDVIVAGRD